MSASGRIDCTVAYATPRQGFVWSVTVPAGASIAEVLAATRVLVGDRAGGEPIPWDSAAVGIFGQVRERGTVCAPGDRIELYRPLRRDPRERRRERVARERRG